jgi:transmembrane sensor
VTDDSSLLRLLDRYLAGELTPAERERFERWVALSPERQAWVASLRKITRETGHIDLRAAATDAAWLRVSHRLGLPAGARDARPAPPDADAADDVRVGSGPSKARAPWGRPQRRFRVAGRLVFAGTLAASVALVTGVALVRELPRHAAPPRRFDTATGEREAVTLSDGTQFMLAPASVVTVDAEYGRSARAVTLDGEASFTVTHDDHRPFSVRTPWATVRDVGTRFVVRAYTDDRRTQVAVREGAVSLIVPGGDAPTATLRPGGAATVDGLGHVALRTAREDDALIAWTRGDIVFRDTPLGDAVRDLGRSFDLDIRIADASLARLPITATFSGQPVDAVLDDITAVVGASYQRSGRAVVIRRSRRTDGLPREGQP